MKKTILFSLSMLALVACSKEEAVVTEQRELPKECQIYEQSKSATNGEAKGEGHFKTCSCPRCHFDNLN